MVDDYAALSQSMLSSAPTASSGYSAPNVSKEKRTLDQITKEPGETSIMVVDRVYDEKREYPIPLENQFPAPSDPPTEKRRKTANKASNNERATNEMLS